MYHHTITECFEQRTDIPRAVRCQELLEYLGTWNEMATEVGGQLGNRCSN